MADNPKPLGRAQPSQRPIRVGEPRTPTLAPVLTTVAVLPEPPLLVPELANGAAAETAELRAACVAAATRLAAAAPRWVAVGADRGGRRTVGPARAARSSVSASTSSSAWTPPARPPRSTRGCRCRCSSPAGRPRPPAPRSGSAASWSRPARARPTAPRWAPTLAAEWAADPEPIGLLVLGDGAATHTERAPGHFDARAAGFDAGVAAALRAADRAALAALDPGLAAELLAAGRAPWQVLAAATAGPDWRGELLHSSAPFGVAYHVAVWTPRRVTPPPLVAVVGPTATGKSDIGLALAAELGGEVVNADAMQLYRGLDIGTAKLTPTERAGVPHHLLDVLDVTETASVAAYQRAARAVVERLRAAGRTPVLVGGSGLYVQAVLDELEFPGTDPALRAELEAELAERGAGSPARPAGRARPGRGRPPCCPATGGASCARWR